MHNPLELDYLVTLDYETYYDTQYSLRNLTYIEYINSPLFKIHGMSVQINDTSPIWYDSKTKVRDALHEIPWNRAGMIGHNLHFDGTITSKKFDIIPKIYLDTLSLARGLLPTIKSHSLKYLAEYLTLGAKDSTALGNVKGVRTLTKKQKADLGVYCNDDVNLTWKLYQTLCSYLPEEEAELIDITLRMQTQPTFMLDVPKLNKIIVKKLGERETLLDEAGLDISQVRSSVKFAAHLAELGVDAPTKISPRTGKQTFAFAKTDLGMQMLTANPDKKVASAAMARLSCMSNLDVKRAQRFIDISNCNNEILPIPLNYYGAHTGRWSGGDKINPQNLTKKSGLRECLLAPPGHLVLAADQSQIEARITAWLAEHDSLLNDFSLHDQGLGPDVYILMATLIYGKKAEDITDDERFIGKMCVLGLGYGMGHEKLCITLNQILGAGSFTKWDTKHMVDTYRKVNYPIKELWNQLNAVIHRMALGQEGTFKILTFDSSSIQLPNGMFLQYPNLRGIPNHYDSYDYEYEYKDKMQKIYGGRLTENIVQALARIVIAGNMIEINKVFPVATMTHDEIVIIPPIARIEEAKKLVTDVMSKPPEWCSDLPLALTIDIGEAYAKS
jgi:DNA polymerase I-like protein with 3'-5' exonuclease and polymerase domains